MNPNDRAEYPVPPIGQTVTRFAHCPCFAERKSLLPPEPICWFCKFAAFDLFSDSMPFVHEPAEPVSRPFGRFHI